MIRIFNWGMLVALGLGLGGCTSLNGDNNDADNDGDEHETTIKFAEAPAAVQQALKEQTKGATIDSLITENEHGKTTYEVEGVMIDGKKYDVEVDANGKLVEKEAADAEDKDGADDDDNDAAEHKEAAAKK
jgi:hypothetical protein